MEVALWKKIGEFFCFSLLEKLLIMLCFDVASLWQNNRIWTNNRYFDTMFAWHVLYLPSGAKGFGMKRI